MENRQTWVNLSFLSASALIAYVVFAFSVRIAAAYDLETRVKDAELIIQGASLAVGALSFLIFYKNHTANQFMNEVVAELSRVTWPTSSDTVRTTFVVLILVLIAGLFLGGMDSLWTWVIRLVV